MFIHLNLLRHYAYSSLRKFYNKMEQTRSVDPDTSPVEIFQLTANRSYTSIGIDNIETRLKYVLPNNLLGQTLSGYSSNTYAPLRRSHSFLEHLPQSYFAEGVRGITGEDLSSKVINVRTKHKPQSRSNTVLPSFGEIPARARKPCQTHLARCFTRIGKYIRSCWKPTRTSPVVTETAIAQHTQSRPPPQIIDVHKETIKIQTNPPIYIRFGELKSAFGKYQNVDRIRNPDTMRKNKYNVVNVAYYLQLMVLLLEGLDEMPALSATDINVIMMKTQMLLFVNYEPNVWLQCTVSQWRAISRQIRDELLYILDDIFDEIGEG